jgi:hypothetical protein
MRAGPDLALTAAVCLSTACGGIGEPVDPNHCKDAYCSGGEMTASIQGYHPPTPLDLLIVLDDSVASGPYAARLESALRALANGIKSPCDGELNPDLNVALVPASMGTTSPSWPATPYCLLPSGPYLHAAKLCDAPNNFQGDLADALSCAALHLPPSSLPPRPLEAIRAFLQPGGLAEAGGFRRKNSYLLLVIVSSQDDPTIADAKTLAAYRDFLGTVVESPDDAILASIVAPAAAPGLASFVKSFGENGDFSDITTAAWSAIPFVTDLRWWGCGSPTLPRLAGGRRQPEHERDRARLRGLGDPPVESWENRDDPVSLFGRRIDTRAVLEDLVESEPLRP